MKKRARGRRAARSAKHIPDSQIDFSDIPEATDEELKRARRVGRPKSGSAKQLIAIRVDPKLLASLRRMAAKLGKPYQTLIHELLEKATRQAEYEFVGVPVLFVQSVKTHDV